ncbi:uncharacterized protein LOC106670931 isoform X2 [Cimex lectularius]|nr:uncharacterized protein LOC106670931 isoform X2 [Cimex lectularius]XP_014257099.1 uncharacterized protein LOC106670931 isoform X2 [Cimex lectularius]XP_024084186.1 uncharacterized protein LOC106670931 isoform X2 [Cimex lectularius]XP_024084187.1 uncharacterized protein LOC106670931 isoform X2 [Cimex lectularius]XP_024084188.1 uncharacterized protein LOC106670931 isoform X2 [Cimex lectularius]
MRDRPLWIWLLTVLFLAIVKAHIRLLLLLALGLAGLYMLHLLVQDFQHINNSFRPGQGSLLSSLAGLSRGKRSIGDAQQVPNWVVERLANDTKEMRQVLNNDPVGCARKYVCHIQSKQKRSRTQDNVLFLLRAFSWLDINGEWKKAEELGRKNGTNGACEKAYKKCWYSGAQLDKFMNMI